VSATLLLALSGAAVGFLLRTQLIEPAEITALCVATPWESPTCAVRSLAIAAFTGQRIGILALAAAVLALLARWRGLAMMTLPVAAAGLVLYAAGWSAPALLLAALAVLPATPEGDRE
jgi:hypothetical protein